MDDTALAGWVASNLAYLTQMCGPGPWTDATSERTGTMTDTQAPPWKGAEIHEGTIPEQARLLPRPVILECQDCYRAGYWYPGENRIDVSSRMCPEGPSGWRPWHMWTLESWNGNEAIGESGSAGKEQQS